MKVTITSHTPEPEQAIIEAAATCWKSVPRKEILDHIIKAGHLTPTEFAVFNFKIEGVSRSLLAQLTRKRVGVAFAVESQRYVKYDDVFDYVTPPSIEERNVLNKDFEYVMEYLAQMYECFLDNGVTAEDARFVLPNACCTTISMTINYHALLDLCKERLCSKAQWEVRGLAGIVKQEVSLISPKLGGYLQPKCYWTGRCAEKNSCGLWEKWKDN